RVVPTVTPLHLYTLNGTLTDQFGGPSLLSDGGTLSSTRYSFGPNQGFRLSGGLEVRNNYSVEFVVTVNSSTPFFRKMIDFQARAVDAGVYLQGMRLTLNPGLPNNLSPQAPVNTDFHFVLTRDSSTGITRLYLNGNLSVSYASGSGASNAAVSA